MNKILYLISLSFFLIFGYVIYNGYKQSIESSKNRTIEKLETELLIEYCKKKIYPNKAMPSVKLNEIDEVMKCVNEHNIIINHITKEYEIILKNVN